ncbi:MAG: 30S ribosomal protein S3 [Candidatus Gygaella obscura]|nr:30S ribosomal protein S3 [Candidatus Gygaella obscura]
MGQKVHPLILRIGFIKDWKSHWIASKANFANYLEEDYRIRKLIRNKYRFAAVSKVLISRLADKLKIKIVTARPGIIIGRQGSEIEKLRDELAKITKQELLIDIEEVKKPAIDAQLVADNIVFQIEKRVAYKRAIKRSIDNAMMNGAGGIRITIAGRLGGAEMKRRETFKKGKIPLATLRADIDYALSQAQTTYGIIGLKVWVFKGLVIRKKRKPQVKTQKVEE